MNVLLLFNHYRSLFNGEEQVVRQTAELIERNGGRARLELRSSRDIPNSLVGKATSFFSGIYSRRAYHEIRARLRQDRPQVVHAHNLFPLLSPSVLVACRDEGVPAVITFHNHVLTCPRADHLSHGKLCERCVTGGEVHCVLKNCRENIFESLGYAARMAAARRFRWFLDQPTRFIALTEFARQRMIRAGFAAERIDLLPNAVPLPQTTVDPAAGTYVAFAGRMSPEKGVGTLLEAARRLPSVSFRLAGDGPMYDAWRTNAPHNVQFVGRLDRAEVEGFYRGARLVASPSHWFEMCPLAILEAMGLGLPVVASRLGGIAELVDDGTTGLLATPADAADLADLIRRLWFNPHLCRTMGCAGRKKAERDYSEETYWLRLQQIYRAAMHDEAP